MSKKMYVSLAFTNIKKNKNIFFPFGISAVTGVGICGIFAAGVIFYTNSFLMKQRSKELGLYSILGMEKRHIANVLFWELALLGFGCTAAGLGFGILFSRLMFLLLFSHLS